MFVLSFLKMNIYSIYSRQAKVMYKIRANFWIFWLCLLFITLQYCINI